MRWIFICDESSLFGSPYIARIVQTGAATASRDPLRRSVTVALSLLTVARLLRVPATAFLAFGLKRCAELRLCIVDLGSVNVPSAKCTMSQLFRWPAGETLSVSQ